MVSFTYRVDWGKHVRRGSLGAARGGIPELNELPDLQTRSIEMKTHGLLKQSRRLIVWATLGVLALIAANGPWLTAVANACQNQGAGC